MKFEPAGFGTKALIDTGSPICAFPRGIGDLLGLTFPDLRSEADARITVLGQTLPAIRAEIFMILPPFNDLGWEASVLFTLDDVLPFGILGYEGFLNRWSVVFNGAMGYVAIEPAEEGDRRFRPALYK